MAMILAFKTNQYAFETGSYPVAKGSAMTDKNPDRSTPRIAVVKETLDRLRVLYEKADAKPPGLSKIGLKPGWNVVIGTGGECGTAFRFSGPHKVYQGQDVAPEDLRRLVGRDLFDVVRENLESPLIPLRSLAVAGLSALSQSFLSEDSLAARGFAAQDDRGVLERFVKPDDVVTIIGYGGMVQNLVGKCRELHVADMRPPESLLTTIIGETVEYAPDMLTFHGPEEDEAILGASDVVIMTASSLVNGTIDELLAFSASARVIGLYGPSASVIPDVLMERGIDFVMSHYVRDPEKFVAAVTTDMNMEMAIRQYQWYRTIVREG
jgi:uncharacterized protein